MLEQNCNVVCCISETLSFCNLKEVDDYCGRLFRTRFLVCHGVDIRPHYEQRFLACLMKLFSGFEKGM